MTVAVTHNTAAPVLGALALGLQTERVLPYLAEVGTQTIRDNLMTLERERPNRLGGPRQHWYRDAADSTDWTAEGNSAIISVSAPGITTRFFGGTIRAGAGKIQCGPNAGSRTRYLTIPVTQESYGKKACDFPDLVVLWSRNGPFALGRKVQRSIATQGRGETTARFSQVLFLLKTEAQVPPDPSLLPSELRMTASLKTAFADYVNLLKEEGMQAGGDS